MESNQAVEPVEPLAPWMGGKSRLARFICQRIDQVPHRTYAEPFVGMGGIYFRRSSRPVSEVINDKSGDIHNLFLILREHYTQFLDCLRYQITSRKEFDRISKLEPRSLTDMQRAARFLYLQCTSYGGKATGQSFGVDKGRRGRFDITRLGPMLEDVHERLAGVVLENLGFAEFIAKYDGPDVLFYLDPPYWDCESDYGTGLFGKADFVLMAGILARLKGRFILSLNDHPRVREIFAAFDIEAVDTRYSVGGGSQKAGEVLITGPRPR